MISSDFKNIFNNKIFDFKGWDILEIISIKYTNIIKNDYLKSSRFNSYLNKSE